MFNGSQLTFIFFQKSYNISNIYITNANSYTKEGQLNWWLAFLECLWIHKRRGFEPLPFKTQKYFNFYTKPGEPVDQSTGSVARPRAGPWALLLRASPLETLLALKHTQHSKATLPTLHLCMLWATKSNKGFIQFPCNPNAPLQRYYALCSPAMQLYFSEHAMLFPLPLSSQ